MDERVFARIPFYDAWMIESFGVSWGLPLADFGVGKEPV
jgi:hypothetical protein